MALDPTLGLQIGANVPQFNPLEAAKRGLELRNLSYQPEVIEQQLAASRQAVEASKTAQQFQQAQIEQEIQKSAQAKRIGDGKAYIQNEASKWIKKDANGNEEKDANGNPVVDMTGLIGHTLSKFPDATIITMGEHSEALSKGIKTASDKTIVTKQISDMFAPILEGIPESNRKAAAEKFKNAWNEKYKGLGDDVLSAFGDLSNNSIQKVKEGVMGSGTAAQNVIARAQLGLEKERVQQSGAQTGTDETGRDPGSLQTQDDYKKLHAAGVFPTLGLSSAQLRNDPQNKAILVADVVPQVARDETLKNTNKLIGLQQSTNDTIKAGKNLLSLPSYKLLPNEKMSNAWAKLSSDKNMQKLEEGVQEYENERKTKIDRKDLSVQGAIDMIDSWRNGSGGINDQINTKPGATYSSAKPMTQAPPSPPVAPASKSNAPLIRTQKDYDALPIGAKYRVPGKDGEGTKR